MKLEYPKWVYVEPQVGGSLDASVVEKADCVYFFTDTLAHKTYSKYIDVVRSHNLRFSYIHGVNIEQTTKHLYKDLAEANNKTRA